MKSNPAPKIKIRRRSPMLSKDRPDKIGTNRSRVIEIRPIMMYSAYCVTTPVSSRAMFWLLLFRVFVRPNGPNSSIAPRSRILDVTNPRPRALLIM
jgi:hypothetical protein